MSEIPISEIFEEFPEGKALRECRCFLCHAGHGLFFCHIAGTGYVRICAACTKAIDPTRRVGVITPNEGAD